MRSSSLDNIAAARFSHGLTSRAVVAAREAEVSDLALALIGETPPNPEVREAAEGVAEAIFALRDIRRVRQEYLSCRAPPTDNTSSAVEAGGGEGPDALVANLCLVLETIREMNATFRRLDEYERKIRSRYKKLVRRFDYVLIESLRRKG